MSAAGEPKAKAVPDKANLKLKVLTRARHDKIDCTGVFTLRHNGRLHHKGVGRPHKGRRVTVLVADLERLSGSQRGMAPRPVRAMRTWVTAGELTCSTQR